MTPRFIPSPQRNQNAAAARSHANMKGHRIAYAHVGDFSSEDGAVDSSVFLVVPRSRPVKERS